MGLLDALRRTLPGVSRRIARQVLEELWTPAVLRVYKRHWDVFTMWARQKGIDLLPRSWPTFMQLLVRYITDPLLAQMPHGPERFVRPGVVRGTCAVAESIRRIAPRLQLEDTPLETSGRRLQLDLVRAAERRLRAAAIQPRPDRPRLPAGRPRRVAIFDARHVLMYWASQPPNDRLSEEQLRAKVIPLHALDRAARVSSLAGTLIGPRHLSFSRRPDGSLLMRFAVAGAKGRRDALEWGEITSFPQGRGCAPSLPRGSTSRAPGAHAAPPRGCTTAVRASSGTSASDLAVAAASASRSS